MTCRLSRVLAVSCRCTNGTRLDVDRAAVECLRRHAAARSARHCRQRQRMAALGLHQVVGREFVATVTAGRRQDLVRRLFLSEERDY